MARNNRATMTNDFFAKNVIHGDYDVEWCEETGNPTISHFSGAVQVFSICNDPCTVQMAADAFKVEPAVIVEAVEFHPWMFLDGPDDDFNKMTIEHDVE